jgi:phage baseplate assembly protein W
MGELLFDSISTTMKTYLEDRIKTTTLVFEPRIDLLDVRINTTRQTEGWLAIEVEYAVRSTNTRYNLVYPFAVNDGNEVRALLGQGA